MTILILGSQGFIGNALVNFYVKKGWDVHGVDLMETATRNYHYHKVSRLSPEFDELLQKINFNACINAAGSGNVSYSMTHPVIDFEANSLDVIRILDAIRRLRPACKYIHISSAAVYGNPLHLPVSEKDILKPLSPYGWHKLISEQICYEYASVYNISTSILRPFSIYGPGLKKQLFWDLYQKSLFGDNEISIWGTGKETRDFIFIADFMHAVNAILQSENGSNQIYNVASGCETTIHEAVSLFYDLVNKDIKPVFNCQVRPGDPLNWRADISKLTSLGFKPEVNFKSGIKELVTWIKSLK